MYNIPKLCYNIILEHCTHYGQILEPSQEDPHLLDMGRKVLLEWVWVYRIFHEGSSTSI